MSFWRNGGQRERTKPEYIKNCLGVNYSCIVMKMFLTYLMFGAKIKKKKITNEFHLMFFLEIALKSETFMSCLMLSARIKKNLSLSFWLIMTSWWSKKYPKKNSEKRFPVDIALIWFLETFFQIWSKCDYKFIWFFVENSDPCKKISPGHSNIFWEMFLKIFDQSFHHVVVFWIIISCVQNTNRQ